MAKLPIVSGLDLIKALVKVSFKWTRRRRHAVLRKPSFPPLAVPLRDELKKGTLLHLLNQAKVTKEQFVKLLKDP